MIPNQLLYHQRPKFNWGLLGDATDILLCWMLLDLLHLCVENRAYPAWSGSPQLRWETHLSNMR